MPVDLKIPQVGDSITEVMISRWLKQPGDMVKMDEPIVELETDKANVEVPSPVGGKLVSIVKPAGKMAKVGEVVANLEEMAVSKDAPAATNKSATIGMAKPAAPADRTSHVMPAAQRLLSEQNISASSVPATGPKGRLLKEDVQRHVDSGKSAAPSVAPSTNGTIAAGSRQEEVVPMSMIRRRIAERLVSAQQSMAILTTFNEVDMSTIIDVRKQFQDQFTKKYGIKLGFMSFFVKAVIDALKSCPQLNAEIRGDDIIYRHYYDIGVAIGGGKGLVVPVIRNAERLSLAEIELQIAEYAKKAQENKITVEEMTGGTFTISNGGVYGSLLSTPIINPPQSGILGMHSMQDRPVAINGQVVIRPMMYIALSYDHRIVDGREAVTCLKRVKEVIENPTRMLIEV